MNYTNGPWKVEFYNGVVLVTSDNDDICAVKGQTPLEKRENASLISASPDMYELLRRVYSAISVDKVTDALHDEINAILNKAEGRSEK